MEKSEKGKKGLREQIQLPDGVEVNFDGKNVRIKGPKGELNRRADDPRIKATIEGGEVIIASAKAGKRERKSLGTLKAHIRNMIKGVMEGHAYKLKACSSHFPMSVSVEGKELVIKNFLGEKMPRKLKLPENVDVKVEGAEITVESTDKENAGSFAAAIERLTKRANYDRRIFQDGIYITEKP